VTTGKAGIAAAEPNRNVGVEARKTYAAKLDDGIIQKYLSGMDILDIGYKGYENDVVAIVQQAIGIDVDYPGYDGRRLPFPDQSQDTVFSSHCLEHVENVQTALSEWFRVLKTNGFLILCVPHQHLYERKSSPPSKWNPDHRRFYTPATLLIDIEGALEPNTYRLRHLIDNDAGYDYSIPPDQHPAGCYEIELVIQRIKQPVWQLDASAQRRASSTVPSSAPLEQDSKRLNRKGDSHGRGFVIQDSGWGWGPASNGKTLFAGPTGSCGWFGGERPHLSGDGGAVWGERGQCREVVAALARERQRGSQADGRMAAAATAARARVAAGADRREAGPDVAGGGGRAG
jgi:SAM-dependent methyltransferase